VEPQSVVERGHEVERHRGDVFGQPLGIDGADLLGEGFRANP
jgi:hypothetical protein